MTGDPFNPDPSTETEIEQADQKVNETLPGSVQDGSEKAFEDTVDEEARANIPDHSALLEDGDNEETT